MKDYDNVSQSLILQKTNLGISLYVFNGIIPSRVSIQLYFDYKHNDEGGLDSINNKEDSEAWFNWHAGVPVINTTMSEGDPFLCFGSIVSLGLAYRSMNSKEKYGTKAVIKKSPQAEDNELQGWKVYNERRQRALSWNHD